MRLALTSLRARLLLFMLGPLVFAVVLAFLNWDGFGNVSFAGFKNFTTVFANEQYRQAAVNTIWFTALQVPTLLISAFVFALLLQHTGKMKKRIVKYYPDEIRMKLGRSYSDYEALQQRSSFESLSGYMDTSGGAVPATVSEELAASISMQEQEKKRETLFGTIIGNGGDDDVRSNE